MTDDEREQAIKESGAKCFALVEATDFDAARLQMLVTGNLIKSRSQEKVFEIEKSRGLR